MSIELPLPENLANMLEAEKNMREQILVATGADDECQDHLKILSGSLEWIKKIGTDRKHNTDDELVVLGLIARTYNDVSVAFGLIISGFYQASLMITRDIQESSLLIRRFALDTSAIQRWKNGKEFSAGDNRKFLKKYENVVTKGNADDERILYGHFSTLGSHPTWKGILRMLVGQKNNLIYSEPFLDIDKLHLALMTLTSMTFSASDSIVTCFHNINALDLALEKDFSLRFIQTALAWLQKYGAKGNFIDE